MTNQLPYRLLVTAEDVTPDVLRAAEAVVESYYPNDEDRIEWDQFWDELVDPTDGGFDIEQTDTPACQLIQRHVRAYRRAQRSA